MYHIPTSNWSNTMRCLKPQKLCKPIFFLSWRKETSWGLTDVKLTLLVRLAYLSPVSCPSGQWSRYNHSTSVQQQLHPVQKSDVGHNSAAWPLTLLWAGLLWTQPSQLPFQVTWSCPCPQLPWLLPHILCVNPWANILFGALVFPWVSVNPMH